MFCCGKWQKVIEEKEKQRLPKIQASNLNISVFPLNVGSSRFCTKRQFCTRWCTVTSHRRGLWLT